MVNFILIILQYYYRWTPKNNGQIPMIFHEIKLKKTHNYFGRKMQKCARYVIKTIFGLGSL